jgi:hypothetical protein
MRADMMDKQGFDLSQGIWRDSGWQEVEDLRKKLESLKELRELVRSLGRAGGKGPLRRAPEEARISTNPSRCLVFQLHHLMCERLEPVEEAQDLMRLLGMPAEACWPVPVMFASTLVSSSAGSKQPFAARCP